MSPRSSSALRRVAALAAIAALPAAGCSAPGERSEEDLDPRDPVIACLREEAVAARPVGGAGIAAGGARIEFRTTAGEAEALQVAGRAQGAEQVGRALVYVGGAPDALLATVEECVDR